MKVNGATWESAQNTVTLQRDVTNTGEAPVTLTSWHIAATTFVNTDVPDGPKLASTFCPAGFSEAYCQVSVPWEFVLDNPAPTTYTVSGSCTNPRHRPTTMAAGKTRRRVMEG